MFKNKNTNNVVSFCSGGLAYLAAYIVSASFITKKYAKNLVASTLGILAFLTTRYYIGAGLSKDSSPNLNENAAFASSEDPICTEHIPIKRHADCVLNSRSNASVKTI